MLWCVVGINAVIAESAVLAVEPIHGVRGVGEAEADEGLEEHEGAENAVTFGDVATDTETAAFFSADEGFAGAEVGNDVFEADRFFVKREIVFAGEAVNHNGAGNGFNHGAGEGAIFEEMSGDEDSDAGGDEVVGAGIESGETVGIAVGDAGEVSAEGAGSFDGGGEILRDWFRGDAVERRIMFGADSFDGVGCTEQEALNISFADAVHGIHEEAIRRFVEDGEISEGANPVKVRFEDREIEDERFGRSSERGVARRRSAEAGFELRGDVGISGSTVRRFEFEAVPFGRIVTRGDHDTAIELMVARGEGDGRSGERFRCEADGNAVGDEDFRGDAGEGGALEAVIIADDDAARGGGASGEIISDGL